MSSLDWDKKQPPEPKFEAQDDLAEHVKRVFQTESGQKLMEFWEKKYLNAQVAPFNQPASFAYLREGQNMIVREVQRLIKREVKK